MPEEEKARHIDEFIEKYNKSQEDLFSEEKKGVFDAWLEVYQATMANRIKNRVKKIL